jgi:hypothetical protein
MEIACGENRGAVPTIGIEQGPVTRETVRKTLFFSNVLF